ncbi:class I SAM-dependent methyltransferase [Actinophytocola gossypii]|uniref:Class I SAM-dependent methyltransferase n=1 Tax=Actinophytocola gossypii TaxID=2812003 RepID=A0ABT2JFX5_9PSEU|nr:class I SAM-dependent methyltransferase [Actinophytocola gossypii]MCT2586769.1 class I SAM-dependent methyltransferase [Actinophytocola gossypii]
MTWASATGRVLGAVYDFGVRREWLARPVGRVLWGADVGELYAGIRALGELPPGSAVLDVPCGGGVALRGLTGGASAGNSAVRYVGVDLSRAMVTRARRRAERLGLGGVGLVEADISALPFGDGGFDVCVCFNGLHCLPDPAGAVREMVRCVRPGGRLVGDVVVSGTGWRQDRAIGILRRAGLFGRGGGAGDLADWLTGAGLRVERMARSGAVVYFVGVSGS